MITPEQARQELAARAAARQSQSAQITPEEARQELAARQAMRASGAQATPQQSQPMPQQQGPSFMQQGMQNLRNVGQEVSGLQQQLAFNPIRAGKVVAGSALNTAQGLTNLLSKIYHYGSLGLSPEAKMNQNYNQVLGVSKPQAGDELLAMAPLIVAPEAIPTKGLGALGKLGARVAEGEAYNQAQGADTGTGAETAAAFSLPDLLLSAGRGRHAIPARLLKGSATPEERAANAAVAGNLPINMGQITQSPIVNKAYENILGEVPFGGVASQQKAVSEGVQGMAEGLQKKAMGDNTSALDPNELLKQRLLAAQDTARAAKNEQYNAVDALAQQEGHKLELPTFTARAQELKDTIGNSPLLQTNPKLKSFMSKMAGYEEAATPKGPQSLTEALTGQYSTGSPSIRDANLAKNELYNAGSALSKSAVASDRYMGGLYKELSGKIAEDIRGSIKEKGSTALQQAFDSANQEYRNNYARFLNKDVMKLLDKDKPADKFARDIIKPGKANDVYSNINLVQSLLPEKERNLLPSAYLSNSLDEFGNVDASKMGQLLRGLGPRQFNALFGGTGLKKGAQDYRRLMEMSANARSNMANPKTGAQLKQLAIGGGLLGATTGPITAATTAASAIGGSQLASRYLTNPKIRAKLLEAMSKSEKGEKYGIKENDFIRQLMALSPRIVSSQEAQQKRGS